MFEVYKKMPTLSSIAGGLPMRFGVYKKLEGRTGVGKLYQFVAVSRHHTTGAEVIVYIPLRIDPSWAGTVRYCHLERAEFERRFEFVSEGLPPADQIGAYL